MAYNILIVDDSGPMRGVIKKIIRSSGFNVGSFFEAANGIEALDVINKEWLDIVLTDYNMPAMNGLELLEEMKKDEIFKSVPVVMVTTEGSNERVEEFISKGAIDYLKKPFTPQQIKDKLNRILGEPIDETGEASSDDSDDDFDF